MTITVLSVILVCLIYSRRQANQERKELLEILNNRQKMYEELYEKYKNDVIEEDL